MNRLQLILVVLSFCLSLATTPSMTWAQDSGNVADEADVLFVLGSEAFRGKRYEEALSYFFSSNRLAPNRNVVYNIARCYEELGRYVEAYRYYLEFSRNASPEETESIRGALERVQPRLAMVDLVSTPPGATVYVDRKELGAFGTTPLSLPLAPGSYRFIVEQAGHLDYESETLTLAAGDRQKLEAVLEPILATLELSGEPAGASIELLGPQGDDDTVLLGALPAVLHLPTGSLRLRVS
ncbi:MAG: PEGA domain-containing protein, partial [Myxococcota bacterium]|nr:PEGA domain-containing protein [Myxococcota bacterium]